MENALVQVEAVNHPSHYQDGGLECIEVMRRVFGDDAVRTFCKLNAFKYVWRSGKKLKSSEQEDTKKAEWYLSYMNKLEGHAETDNSTGTSIQRQDHVG